MAHVHGKVHNTALLWLGSAGAVTSFAHYKILKNRQNLPFVQTFDIETAK